MVLPRFRGEFRRRALHAVLVVGVGEERTVRAAAVLGAAGHDAVAGGPRDAGAPGQQPGQIGADQMLVVGGVEELDPLTGEIEVDLFGPGGGRSVHDDADLGAATHLRQRTRAGREGWIAARFGVLYPYGERLAERHRSTLAEGVPA